MTEPRKLEALTRPADPEVISLLEELLAKAKRGEVVGVVWASVDGAGSTRQGYAGMVWASRMIGSIEILKQVIIKDVVLE